MKGHMQDGKFHPHTEYKGVRKSRDQQVKQEGVVIRKARNGKLDTIPESVLFRVLNSHDIPDDIGHLVWSRTISVSKYRDRQKNLERRGKEPKFKLTDEEIEQVTRNEDEKTDAELRARKKREDKPMGVGNTMIGGTASVRDINFDQQNALQKNIENELLRIIRMKPAGLSSIEITQSDRWGIELEVHLLGGMLGGDVVNLANEGWKVGSIHADGKNVAVSIIIDRTKYR